MSPLLCPCLARAWNILYERLENRRCLEEREKTVGTIDIDRLATGPWSQHEREAEKRPALRGFR